MKKLKLAVQKRQARSSARKRCWRGIISYSSCRWRFCGFQKHHS